MSKHQRTAQRRKGSAKPRQLVCKKTKFKTREEANARILQIKNKGIRGSARLQAFQCKTCSRKSKGIEIFHIGYRKKVDF